MTAVMGAAGGNVTGSAAQFAQAAVVTYLQGLAATEVKRIADGLGAGADAEAARAALHAIVGCAGAAGGGANCASGALGAGASSLLAVLLANVASDDLSAQEKEARGNLIQSIVAGAAVGLSMDAAASVSAAATELANNALSLGELKAFAAEAGTCQALGNCEQVQQKYRELSVENQEKMIALCAQDPTACRAQYGDFVEGVTDYRKELDAAFGLDIPLSLKADLAIYLYQHQEAIGVALNTEIAVDLQERYGLTSETAGQLAAVGSAAVGVIKGKYQPNAGSVGNMSELLRQPGFGVQIGNGSRKTRQTYQGQSVYKATGAVGDYIDEGDRFYLDAMHKNHLEVFDKNGKIKAVLNLDGTLNNSKTDRALIEARRLPK